MLPLVGGAEGYLVGQPAAPSFPGSTFRRVEPPPPPQIESEAEPSSGRPLLGMDSESYPSAESKLVVGGKFPAKVARRRRFEILKFRQIANSSGFEEPVPKRPRSSPTSPLMSGSIILRPSSMGFEVRVEQVGSGGEHQAQASTSHPSNQVEQPADESRSSQELGTSLAALVCTGAPGQDQHAERSLSQGCRSTDACPPHGAVFLCGRRREMEDAVSVVPSFVRVPCRSLGGCSCGTGDAALHFFAVYDGHGGSEVALSCKEHLHHILGEELTRNLVPGLRPEEQEAQVRRAMVDGFCRMDADVGGFGYRQDGREVSQYASPAPEMVGSTAVVAVVGPKQIIVANCGDSRAVLSRAGQAVPLSRDHKPENEKELARVEASGGKVIFWNGYRVLGVLAMSRAIGDRYLKPHIIAEPDVTCTERTVDDECLILASDGLWDVLSNEIVCEIARRCLERASSNGRRESAADMAAALLTKVALAKGSSDNISVVVIDLTTPR